MQDAPHVPGTWRTMLQGAGDEAKFSFKVECILVVVLW